MAPPRSTSMHGKGPIEPSRKDLWVQAASGAILDLIEQELAIVVPELEARLGDQGARVDGRHHYFDPHIISEARRQLLSLSAIAERSHVTKGGGRVDALVPADTRRRETAIGKAVARKAMLYRRFLTLSRTAV